MVLRRAFVLLLAVLVLGCQGSVDNNALRGTSDAAVDQTEQRRELISFWAVLFHLLPHPPCGEGSGPHGPLHPKCHDHDSSTSTYESDQKDDDGRDENDDTSNYSEESSSTSASDSVAAGGKGMAKSSILLMVVAGLAATAALAAAVVGQRRDKESAHPLNGAVSRRMNLFTALADGNLCGDRPPRTAEAGGYRMA